MLNAIIPSASAAVDVSSDAGPEVCSGITVTFTCRASAIVAATARWRYDGEDRILATGASASFLRSVVMVAVIDAESNTTFVTTTATVNVNVCTYLLVWEDEGYGMCYIMSICVCMYNSYLNISWESGDFADKCDFYEWIDRWPTKLVLCWTNFVMLFCALLRPPVVYGIFLCTGPPTFTLL